MAGDKDRLISHNNRLGGGLKDFLFKWSRSSNSPSETRVCLLVQGLARPDAKARLPHRLVENSRSKRTGRMFRGQLNPWGPTMVAGHGRQGHRPPPVRHGLEAWPTPSPQQRAMMLSSLLREKDELRECIAQQELKIPVVTIGLFNGKPSWPKWPNLIPLGGHQVQPSRFGRHVFTHSPVPLHGTFQRSRTKTRKWWIFFGTIWKRESFPVACLHVNWNYYCWWFRNPQANHTGKYIYIYIKPYLNNGIFSISPGELEIPGISEPAIHHPHHSPGRRFRRRRHGTKSCSMCASDVPAAQAKRLPSCASQAAWGDDDGSKWAENQGSKGCSCWG